VVTSELIEEKEHNEFVNAPLRGIMGKVASFVPTSCIRIGNVAIMLLRRDMHPHNV
jgi:hypothetical protein